MDKLKALRHWIGEEGRVSPGDVFIPRTEQRQQDLLSEKRAVIVKDEAADTRKAAPRRQTKGGKRAQQDVSDAD